MDDPPKTPWSLTGDGGEPAEVDPALVDAGLGWLAPLYEAGAKMHGWSPREMDEMEPWEIAVAFSPRTSDGDDDEPAAGEGGIEISRIGSMFGGLTVSIGEVSGQEG